MATYNTTVDVVDVNAAIAGNAVAGAVPNGYNGAAMPIDLARPSDWTDDYGHICVEAGSYNLRGTIEWHLFVAQGKPAAAAALTQEHVTAAIPHIRGAIARLTFYQIFYHSGVDVLFRASDVIAAPNAALGLGRAAREVYRILTTGDIMLQLIAEIGQLILLSFIANAIHREQNGDHSWFSAEIDIARSPIAKILGIAGRLLGKFKDYMRIFGHRGNHHLSTATISAIASILAGTAAAVAGSRVQPQPANHDYAGRDILGEDLATVFVMPESCNGRFPAGILGKASIIVGLEMGEAMIMDMTTRIKIDNIARISLNVGRLSTVVSSTTLEHDVLLQISAALSTVLAFVHGYGISRSLFEVDTYKAFDAHATRHPAASASGTAVAKAVAAVTPHDGAVGSAVVSAINRFALAVETACAVVITVAGQPAPLVARVVAHDPALVTAHVGKSDMARLMEMQAGMRGGGGGYAAGPDVFQDANQGN